MTDTYYQLFQLNFQHEYFVESMPENIFKVGTILKNELNVRIKRTQKGFITFVSDTALFYHSKLDHGNQIPLYVPVDAASPNFFNYTQIDYNPSTIICFQYKNDSLVFSPTTLFLQPNQFIYPLTIKELQSIQSIELINPIGLIQSLPIPFPPYNNGVLVDLNGALEGSYQLIIEIKGRVTKIVYNFFASDQIYNNPVPFIFELKINLKKYVTNLKSLSYDFLFETRKTYWRYIFVNLKEQIWETAEISPVEIDNKYAVFEKSKEAILLENGQLAFEAISTLPIPLQYRPQWKIWLKSSRLLEDILLPYPSPDNLTLLNSTQTTSKKTQNYFYSEIYCHI